MQQQHIPTERSTTTGSQPPDAPIPRRTLDAALMHILPILSDAYKHNLNLICEIQCFVPTAAAAAGVIPPVHIVVAATAAGDVEGIYRNLYYFALHKTNTSNSHLCSSSRAEVGGGAPATTAAGAYAIVPDGCYSIFLGGAHGHHRHHRMHTHADPTIHEMHFHNI